MRAPTFPLPLALILGFLASIHLGVAAPVSVRPIAQTAPMHGTGDVADDICVWIHPLNPARSVILGGNKSDERFGGIYAFDLNGGRWKESESWRKDVNWFDPGKKVNNVDLCKGASGSGETWDIVAAANRTDRTLDLFRVRTADNGDFAGLESVARIPIGNGFAEGPGAPYGLALAWLDAPPRWIAFASDTRGRLAQYEFRVSGNKLVGERLGGPERPWQISQGGGEVEGIEVDVRRAVVYVAAEKEGVFRYCLKDGVFDPASKVIVDRAGGGRLKADVEGLALYARADGGAGYLLVSSQGSSQFAVYRREFSADAPNAWVSNFNLGKSGAIDAVTETDGIEALSANLGGPFSDGLFIAHDGEGPSPTNYKIVPWSAITEALEPGR